MASESPSIKWGSDHGQFSSERCPCLVRKQGKKIIPFSGTDHYREACLDETELESISEPEKCHGNTPSNKAAQSSHFQINVWKLNDNRFPGTRIAPKEWPPRYLAVNP
jgi:hypothetical protein